MLRSLLLVVCFSTVCVCDGPPEVETPLGKIRGFWKESYGGKKYAAFEGIPYAKPPVGLLRFEEPEPVEPWPGVWHATKPYSCLHIKTFVIEKVEIVGQEDCLYVNVYVPSEKVNPQKQYDVLVHIHGGAFRFGSGHILTNSDFSMDLDLIWVSINYRLGMFGFLSTEDAVVPGNNGMKDQVLALKWIKNNIASFGGNPDSVTTFGVSAGGAAVHLHYFSPLSRGLFQRSISHSGTALDPWTIKENPLRDAKKLAVSVGCPDSSSQELKSCLQTRPDLLLAEKIVDFFGIKFLPSAPFAPVIEVNSEKAFLTKQPYDLLKEKNVMDVPWIVSSTSDESAIIIRMLGVRPEEWNKTWPEVAHYVLEYNDTVPVSKRSYVANKVKEFYLGADEAINAANIMQLGQSLAHRQFMVGSEISAKLQSKAVQSPVYYQLFNYAVENSYIIRSAFPDDLDIKGVAHTEDMIYFYGVPMQNFSETDLKMKSICQDILYSFVTTGKPSFGRVEWLPTKGSNLTYLNITSPDDIKLQTVDNLTPVTFWSSLGIMENDNLIAKDEL